MLSNKILGNRESVSARVKGNFIPSLFQYVPLAVDILLYLVHIAQTVTADALSSHAVTSVL